MEREGFTRVPKNLQFRVGLLLGLTIMVAAGFLLYTLYARGVFEATQRLTLIADNAEGVSIGMDLTFSGFPIGRVRRTGRLWPLGGGASLPGGGATCSSE